MLWKWSKRVWICEINQSLIWWPCINIKPTLVNIYQTSALFLDNTWNYLNSLQIYKKFLWFSMLFEQPQGQWRKKIKSWKHEKLALTCETWILMTFLQTEWQVSSELHYTWEMCSWKNILRLYSSNKIKPPCKVEFGYFALT